MHCYTTIFTCFNFHCFHLAVLNPQILFALDEFGEKGIYLQSAFLNNLKFKKTKSCPIAKCVQNPVDWNWFHFNLKGIHIIPLIYSSCDSAILFCFKKFLTANCYNKVQDLTLAETVFTSKWWMITVGFKAECALIYRGGEILFSVLPILMSQEPYITVTQQIGHGGRQYRPLLVTGNIH